MVDLVTFPASPGLQIDKPRLIDYGGQLDAPLGGPTQSILRIGTRFALDMTIPKMPTEPLGRIWGSRLCRAKVYGLKVNFGQDGLVIGNPGSPVVNGGGQSGIALSLRNFAPNYAVREGQFFTMVHSGIGYLHFAAADAVANASGVLNLPIFPMLRVLTTDGDGCNFLNPWLQGSLSGNEASWTRLTEPWSDFGTISVTEDQ